MFTLGKLIRLYTWDLCSFLFVLYFNKSLRKIFFGNDFFYSCFLWLPFEAYQQETMFLGTSDNQGVAQGKARSTICSPGGHSSDETHLWLQGIQSGTSQRKAAAPTKAWSLGTSAIQSRGQGAAAPDNFLKRRRAGTTGPEEKLLEASAPCTALPLLGWQARTGHCKASVSGVGMGETGTPDAYFIG